MVFIQLLLMDGLKFTLKKNLINFIFTMYGGIKSNLNILQNEIIMADITMCNGIGCEAKETCYRYKAIPNEHRQSYFQKSPIENNGCEYYYFNVINKL